MSRPKDGFERMNTHQTLLIEQEVLGTTLRLAQDPNSAHLGTTVWDSSIVLAKFLEKNIRKGDFARSKVRGKRAIELGAGMGLGGIAFAMVGADVVLTDTIEVLPLLRRNVENNLSAAALHDESLSGLQMTWLAAMAAPAVLRLALTAGLLGPSKPQGQDGSWISSLGKVSVQVLDWAVPAHAAALLPPVDYILAADCVYHEHVIEHLHRTILDLTTEKSTVLVCNEFRSHSVHNRFLELFSAAFLIKQVPHSKMDTTFQHPQIELYILKKRRRPVETPSAGNTNSTVVMAAELNAPDGGAKIGQLQDSAAAALAPAPKSKAAARAEQTEALSKVSAASAMSTDAADAGPFSSSRAIATQPVAGNSDGSEGAAASGEAGTQGAVNGHGPGPSKAASDSLIPETHPASSASARAGLIGLVHGLAGAASGRGAGAAAALGTAPTAEVAASGSSMAAAGFAADRRSGPLGLSTEPPGTPGAGAAPAPTTAPTPPSWPSSMASAVPASAEPQSSLRITPNAWDRRRAGAQAAKLMAGLHVPKQA